MASSRPRVVLLAPAKAPWFEDMHAHLLEGLRSKAHVEEVSTAEAASALFGGRERPVVLAIDHALTENEFARQRAEAVTFVQTGGTIIFCCSFPSRTNSSNMGQLFAAFSLPWEMAQYCRTDFYVNSSMAQINTSNLVPRYSQKAVQLGNVQHNDAVYLPSASSRTQSMVFAPEPVQDLSQTPAAFGTSGQGKVGYMGDVNAEIETTEVLLAMCGLSGRAWY